MRWQPDRERSWRSWLITTAEREAWRLRDEKARDLRLDVPGSEQLKIEPSDPADRLEGRTCVTR